MLQIVVNGLPAAVSDNCSFDFISENPLFTDADQFSLAIVFPLKDCPENLEIFGNINRHGAPIDETVYDMHIISGTNSFHGSGVVISVSDIECKIQFLGKRSSDNYYSDLDKVYINTLDLGMVPVQYWLAENVTVRTAWAGHSGGMDFVAIPWVNEDSGNIQNNTRFRTPADPADKDSDTSIGWVPGADQLWLEPEDVEDTDDYRQGLSWFPYLIDIARAICSAIGFSCDFSFWENSKWYHLLLCHAVPYTWNHFWATLLPHWSVIEFFRNLEPILEGCFEFDYTDNTITFTAYSSFFSHQDTVCIDDVIDEFSSDVFDKEDECKMISQRYAGYSVSDSKVAKAYSCQWLIRYLVEGGFVESFDTAEDLQSAAIAGKWRKYNTFTHRSASKPVYAWKLEDSGRYVSHRVVMSKVPVVMGDLRLERDVVTNVPILINNLGPRCIPDDRKDAESTDLSIDIVPAVIDDTDNRRMLFIPLGQYDDGSDDPIYDSDDMKIGEEIYDSATMRLLEKGEDDGSNAYFSNLSVGFYPGAVECYRGGNEILPIVDNVEFDYLWRVWRPQDPTLTLSLQDSDGKFAGIPKLNTHRKFEFSFISDSLPDVKSLFLIRGHFYVCEKLTATFSKNGMSQKIKGSFWRLIAD